MSNALAITGASIFDGERFYEDHALLVEAGLIAGICHHSDAPFDGEVIDLDGGLLAPAYVDLQVNGGGGILLNESPDLDGIRTICRTHARLGTCALLPTLITDAPDVTTSAIAAGQAAAEEDVPGFLGLHLEGPHLSVEKRGAHDAKFIRPMTDDDMQQLLDAKPHLPVLMVTVAPEVVSDDQISALSKAGIIVSLGHSASTFARVQSAVMAGASCITHLFNAMSPLGHREPGLVGAALQVETLQAGLIADGFHVAPEVIAIAIAAKKGPSGLFLVTDAMATVGADADFHHFMLNGRSVSRRNGQLVLENGKLAGSDLHMHAAVMFLKDRIGTDLGQALNMASLSPAQCVGCDDKLGRLAPGYWANIIHMGQEFEVNRVWIRGEAIH